MPVFAGYQITTTVEDLPTSYRYTWSIYNIDQEWGLDGFAVAAPSTLQVLSTVAPSGYRAGYWGYDEWHNPGLVGRPPSGKKWLAFWGYGESSVYPIGSTATYKLTTSKDFVPATTENVVITFANTPGGYRVFYGTIIGPTVPVPEPSSLLIFGGGMVGLLATTKRRRG